MFEKLKIFLKILNRPNHMYDFLNSLDKDSSILDVGCGNDSVFYIKQISKKFKYTGIDIHDYNLSDRNKSLIDDYIIVEKEFFSQRIFEIENKFDAVICSHNLEHCDKRMDTLLAMMNSVEVGGKLYLSFPCEESINFPKRSGTLNYYDDQTHKETPPNFRDILNIIRENHFSIEFSCKRYRPLFPWLIGLLFEPFSSISKKKFTGTWELYGFESIIQAKKLIKMKKN